MEQAVCAIVLRFLLLAAKVQVGGLWGKVPVKAASLNQAKEVMI